MEKFCHISEHSQHWDINVIGMIFHGICDFKSNLWFPNTEVNTIDFTANQWLVTIPFSPNPNSMLWIYLQYCQGKIIKGLCLSYDLWSFEFMIGKSWVVIEALVAHQAQALPRTQPLPWGPLSPSLTFMLNNVDPKSHGGWYFNKARYIASYLAVWQCVEWVKNGRGGWVSQWCGWRWWQWCGWCWCGWWGCVTMCEVSEGWKGVSGGWNLGDESVWTNIYLCRRAHHTSSTSVSLWNNML